MKSNLMGNLKQQTGSGKIEIIVVIVLTISFIGVLLGATWDLYAKNLLCKCNCNSAVVAVNSNVNSMSGINSSADVPSVLNVQKPDQNQQNTNTASNQTKPLNPAGKANTVAYASYSTCIENTKDLAASKDCCDCLSGDASVHKACRDTAATYDFSKNTVFKTFDIPSVLGQNGDYSACTASGTQQQCKQCCENSGNFVCGDFRFCRTACASLPQ